MYYTGLIIGIGTFLIIGLCHPIVIKTEYYFGLRYWWTFLVIGLAFIAGALLTANTIVSSLLGVAGFSFLWGILELFEQQERVHKGWFPRNPKRRYPWDEEEKK